MGTRDMQALSAVASPKLVLFITSNKATQLVALVDRMATVREAIGASPHAISSPTGCPELWAQEQQGFPLALTGSRHSPSSRLSQVKSRSSTGRRFPSFPLSTSQSSTSSPRRGDRTAGPSLNPS